MRECRCECRPRLFDTDQGLVLFTFEGWRNDQASGSRGPCQLGRLQIADKAQLVCAGSFKRRRRCNLTLAIAFKRGPEQGGKLSYAQTGRSIRSLYHTGGVPIDPSAVVSPTARLDPTAVVGPQCRIGDFCVVEADVVIGRNCRLEPYVYVKRWTTLGDDNEISAGTVLGTDPLDKGFSGERSYLRIGSANKIREHYTISRGTKPESVTEVGDENYIMTSGHIAHNAKIGSRVVIASCALVAGYVEIEDEAFISGGVVIHQFSKVGRLAMIGGNTRVNADVPPFFLYSGFNVKPVGLNALGLQRAGFSAGEIRDLKKTYRLLYNSGLKLSEALDRIASDCHTSPPQHLVSFIRSSQRGICRP